MLKLERGTRFELATACLEGTEWRPSPWALFAAAAAAYSAMTMHRTQILWAICSALELCCPAMISVDWPADPWPSLGRLEPSRSPGSSSHKSELSSPHCTSPSSGAPSPTSCGRADTAHRAPAPHSRWPRWRRCAGSGGRGSWRLRRADPAAPSVPGSGCPSAAHRSGSANLRFLHLPSTGQPPLGYMGCTPALATACAS